MKSFVVRKISQLAMGTPRGRALNIFKGNHSKMTMFTGYH